MEITKLSAKDKQVPVKKKYQIIYADPAWDGLGWNNGSGLKCPANHYEVRSVEWIKSLRVKDISDENSALFLWVTFPNLENGIDVIKSWGFKYSTCAFNWVKKCKKSDKYFIGCGNYTRANSEICLLGVRGSMQKRVISHSVRQICDAKILRHSEKPAEIRNRIVELFGNLPRIELFARQETEGWDTWGNECPCDVDLLPLQERI